jgi:glycosyltransferase involved in cell wall biosynthesis
MSEMASPVPASRPADHMHAGAGADPLVSVIIPCYNAAETIRRTLASVRQQTYPRFEIIAVDDCSSDATLAILREEAAQGVRVVAREHNGGVAAARNDAVAVAQGEFLAFIDSDDEWYPEKLRRQVELISGRDRMVLVGARAEERRLDGERVPVNPDRWPPVGDQAWRLMLRYSYYVPSVLFARSATARRIRGFNPALRAGEEDQDFCIRMALAGEVGFVDEVLTTMHKQPTSLSLGAKAREDETVLPMILRHVEALRRRLGGRELRQILGARYTQIGRNVYLARPAAGARLLARAICHGSEPGANLWYLVTASPPLRRLKDLIRRRG